MFQVMAQINSATDPEKFVEVHDTLQRGDIIGIVGYPGRTAPKGRDVGELSIFAREVVLLTPCLHQLPTVHCAAPSCFDSVYHVLTDTDGFKDQEQRHRKKFLDLIMNDRTRETFITRSKIVKFIRRYLDDRGMYTARFILHSTLLRETKTQTISNPQPTDFLEVQTPMMNKVSNTYCVNL
jgi:lysyl-tRNA synthetase, class II